MTWTEIYEWAKANPGLFIFGAMVVLVLGIQLNQKLGVHFSYLTILLVVLAWAGLTGHMLYFYAFCLGMVTALAEIIGKFSDEPLKSLRTPHALVYHVLNGSIAMLALKVLLINGMPVGTAVEQFKAVTGAGLGSMLVIRSKLFNLKVDGEDISFGPEQMVRVFLKFMETAIDRVRAQSRIEFVTATMSNINFDRIYNYTLTMLHALQALEDKERTELETRINEIKAQAKDEQLKSYDLGYALLDKMGEDFVAKVFQKDRIPIDCLIQAPMPEKRSESFISKLPLLRQKGEETVQYFAYGSSMSSRRFRERLGWTDPAEFFKATNPRKCVLAGYRIAFNNPDTANNQLGRANLVADNNGKVEGVLYQLTRSAVEYLKQSEQGGKPIEVKVKAGEGDVDALAYVSETPREGLAPSREYIQLVLDGAREHGLGSDYVAILESFLPKAATA